MAAVPGTITGIHGITSPKGDFSQNGSGLPILGAFIDFTVTGTYVQGGSGGWSITGVPTALQGFLHNGKTIVILQAAFACPGDEQGTLIGSGQVTVSGSTLSGLLLQPDMATEHAAGVLGTIDIPITLFISYTEV